MSCGSRRPRQPVGPAQLIHGDLTGNVLLRAEEPPPIIDFSPYWRPSSYAEGIVMADALCWHEAPLRTVEDLGVEVGAVARGLLFRVLTSRRLHQGNAVRLRDEVRHYESVMVALNL